MRLESSNHYFVYIVTNEYKSAFEVDITGDLSVRLYNYERELRERNGGQQEGYFCRHLVWWEHFTNVEAALRREAEVRQFSVKRRKELVTEANPQCRSLNGDVELTGLPYTM